MSDERDELLPGGGLELLDDDDLRTVRTWVIHAVGWATVPNTNPPAPLCLCGPGADLLGRWIVQRLLQIRIDALGVPWSWISRRGAGPPSERLPAVLLALLRGGDDYSVRHLETLGMRTALLATGDDGSSPVVGGRGGTVIVDLGAEQQNALQVMLDDAALPAGE